MNRSKAILLALLAASCSRHEVAHLTFTGAETQEATVTMPSAGSVHFESAIEVDLSNTESSVNDEWNYDVSATAASGETSSVVCDAFGFAPGGLYSDQSDKHLRLSRRRLLGCNVDLRAGTSTLRVKLAQKRAASEVTPVKVDLFVVR